MFFRKDAVTKLSSGVQPHNGTVSTLCLSHRGRELLRQ